VIDQAGSPDLTRKTHTQRADAGAASHVGSLASPGANRASRRLLLLASHMRQFAGEDWQTVAIDIASSNGIVFEDEFFNELCTGPDEACECGFCSGADWVD